MERNQITGGIEATNWINDERHKRLKLVCEPRMNTVLVRICSSEKRR